ncbi:MAG TPA: hypothetical protein VEF71_15225 [Streptosporangiaceae bacterium]|nr:hypothetical protein [Streptosporangiaceae bacterium]
MTLISQPGSDYQLAVITIDAGNAREIMLMLTDVSAVPVRLACRAAPAAARQAAASLRDADSPCTVAGLAAAAGEVVTWLGQAGRDAAAHITPPPGF